MSKRYFWFIRNATNQFERYYKYLSGKGGNVVSLENERCN